MDATRLLESDHKALEGLFREYALLRKNAAARREELYERIRHELEVHAEVEEALFYPALRTPAGGADGYSVSEALREHAEVDRLLADLERKDPRDPSFDGTMKQVRELVERHVDAEESALFPRARKALTSEALEDLGQKMETLKRSRTGGPRFRRTA